MTEHEKQEAVIAKGMTSDTAYSLEINNIKPRTIKSLEDWMEGIRQVLVSK